MGVGTFCELSSRRRAVTVTVCNWPSSALALLALLLAGAVSGAWASSAQVGVQLALPASNRARGRRLSRRGVRGEAMDNGLMGGSWSENIQLVYSLKLFIYVFTKIYCIRDCLYKEST